MGIFFLTLKVDLTFFYQNMMSAFFTVCLHLRTTCKAVVKLTIGKNAAGFSE